VLVSGNFFNLYDQYHALEPKVDLIITEMRNTQYKQPAWYRYVAGFAGPKPVVVVENPYGGVVAELVAKLKVGAGFDLFRMSLYEAAALGANMSVPYGAWMGSEIEDSFWPPHELCVEIQSFLADHEQLFSPRTYSEVAVVYSVASNFERVARRDQFADNRSNVSGDDVLPFDDVCARLSAAAQPYDVIFFPDGELRADDLTHADLSRYRTLVLPAVTHLTDRQRELLETFERAGGRVVDHDRFDEHADAQLVAEPGGDLAVNVQHVERGAAVHVVRYAYDEALDAVPPLSELTLDVRLPEMFRSAKAFSPDGTLDVALDRAGERHRLTLRDVGLYGVVVLER
jgi:hypothetical protein